MKAIFATVLCALFALAASAGKPHFTVCSGSGAVLQNVVVTSPEAVWNPSSTVHFTIEGDVSEAVASGSIANQAYYAGMSVEDKTDDFCSTAPFACPTAAGRQKWDFSMDLPDVPFAGDLTSHSDFSVNGGKQFLCLELDVHLS